MEIGRSYVSVIATIICNITVLVSHSFTCFGYSMPMMRGKVSIRMLTQLPSPHPTLLDFSPGLLVELPEILHQPSFTFIRLFQKIMHFQSKTNFSSNLLLVSFDFAILCSCVSSVPFQSSSIVKLRLASYLYIWIACYLVSHQIMWHNKRIHGHGLKITYCCFFLFLRKLRSRLILLCHFGNVNKDLFRYC